MFFKFSRQLFVNLSSQSLIKKTVPISLSFVFLNKEHHLYKQETINRVLNGIISAHNKQEQELAILENRSPNNLPDISPHLLRHTFCTRMAENGMDIKVLQEIMGHANIAVTMQVYNHVDSIRVQKEIEKIEDIICI